MNSFVGKIHLIQDKLMSVEMWYVDATPWCSAIIIRYADLFLSLAEGVGFEPTIRFPVYTLSKRAPSATRPSLLQGKRAI
jgi:hypothetical protein